MTSWTWDLGRRRTIMKHRRNALVQQINVNRQEQRARKRVFRNGGRIISYTMSNTESWAWANPPTKKLRASSLKQEFNATEWGLSLGLSIKHDDFVFFGNIFAPSEEVVEKLLDLRFPTVCSQFTREYLCSISLSLKEVIKIIFLNLKYSSCLLEIN